MRIRDLEPHEWALIRELRLRALADSPDAVAGMWVEAEARGRGVGRALLESVIGWARSLALDRLELWVTEGNGSAMRLYERAGFADTGRRDALASNPALQIIQMALNL